MNRAALIVIVLLTAGIADGARRSEKWTNPEAWGRLIKEMPDSKVIGLLGEPAEKVTTPRMDTWYYQQPSAKNETRPYGFVRFKKTMINGRESYTVYNFRKPDWELLRAQLEAEEIRQTRGEEQARLEEQRIAAEKKLERQRRREQAEQNNIARKQQAETKQVQRKKDLETLQLKRERERAELRSYKPRGLAARYFLVLGIAFAGAAIVFMIARKRAES